jgi:hypothetical protein
MMKRLLMVTLLITLASNLCMAQYRFSGTFYQLRWGETEDSQDLITPVNALGNPLCVKMGSSWSATLEGVGGLIGWKVSYARLRSLVDGTVNFTVNDPGVSNLKMPGQPYPLPDVPSYVDHAQLEVSYVICYWGSWGPTYYLTPIYSSEVFVVLDAPKAPMSPAWVNVLRLSCDWASRAADEATAARKVTNALHLWGEYQEGEWFTRHRTDSFELFYLRMCLAEFMSSFIVGQCNDFADLLLCLQTSLGLSNRAVQRTHSLSQRTRPIDDEEWTLLYFRTKPLDVAHWGSSHYDGVSFWTYHQFCIERTSGRVWDSCIQFHPSYRIAVTGMPREPDYRDYLVEAYIFGIVDAVTGIILDVREYTQPDFFWRPTPSGGFIPGLTAESIP